MLGFFSSTSLGKFRLLGMSLAEFSGCIQLYQWENTQFIQEYGLGRILSLYTFNSLAEQPNCICPYERSRIVWDYVAWKDLRLYEIISPVEFSDCAIPCL